MDPKRQPLPDLAPACALFGIALVNVKFFASTTVGAVLESALVSASDRAVWWIIVTFFMFKSYSLFALMFGYGFGRQQRAAEAQETGIAAHHARRMLGLLLLGLLNAAFLFYGDILVVYSLLGSLLYLFRDTEPRALRRWAFGFYALQIVMVLLLLLGTLVLNLPDNAAMLREALAETAQVTDQRVAGFSASGFFEVADVRFGAWAEDFTFLIFLQGLGAAAFILYGLYASRVGLFDDLDAPRWSRARRIRLPLGVLLAAWLRCGASPIRDFLGRAGGASLTAYLLQGLLLSWVFSGYGLGLVGKLSVAAYVPIGAAAALASLLFVGVWRKRYEWAPVEMLLRRWVYLGRRAPPA